MKTICIDPGHGGHDSGAVGPGGLKESDVVLAVALIVASLLKAHPDCRVVMTRKDDTFVTLSARAKIANEAKADVFLSLHCNSAKRAAMGIETFIARKTRVSFPLGEAIQDELVREFPDHTDRGLKRAGFYVLRHTDMAAALAELEFIHVACGEKHLSNSKVRLRKAKALARGVLEFLGLPKTFALATDTLPIKDEDDEPVACPALPMAERLDGVAEQLRQIAAMARES